MATRKPAAKAAEEESVKTEETAEAPSFADEVHERGGWAVGYTGDRVDDADDDAYTVTGVVKAAKADNGDK